MTKNVVIAQFLTNMYDTQRGQTLQNVDVTDITKDLYESVARFDTELHTIINFENPTTPPPLEKLITVEPFKHYLNNKLYFLRWEVTFDYLLKHPEIDKAALVDAGDVEMMNYPFNDVNEGIIYVGDEYNDLTDGIITCDNKPYYLNNFIQKNRSLQLLNTGVMIGTRKTLLEFLAILIKLIVEDARDEKFYPDQDNLGSLEMALTNYVLYNFFSDRIQHGRKITNQFEFDDRDSQAWFKHK
ncbi:hypothetical protein OZX56_07550 [Lactobacillus sp. ESL0684]|uniref:hypothetical protein n=1 Tax=Lactobacillus sp. ESL0684 TaxID=2983213 RepID=UPI0023F80E44|nr:hypothetical protein [Lactobacillus sp. ESL0684]WEV43348.1 hypothetical protein OZX56_07550 [Lactobacillus sp. ESL0684]